MNHNLFKKGLMAGLLLFMSQVCWGLVFHLTPYGTLPTQMVPGETIYAYYNVKNNSGVYLGGNLLALPKNVSQSTIPEPSGITLCGAAPFNLGANQTCVLKLAVRGAVYGHTNDPDDQIYVCLSDGLNCSGTAIQNHNTLTVHTKSVQTAYVADQTYNTTGGIGACVVQGNGNLSNCSYANLNFNTPLDVIINDKVNPPIAYVANFDNGTNGYVSVCTLGMSGSVMQLQTCSSVTDNKIFAPVGLRLSLDGKRLYITNSNVGNNDTAFPLKTSVAYCNVNANGSLSLPCQEVLGSAFDEPGSVWIAGNYAYVANAGAIAHHISICPLQADNTFGNCTSYGDEVSIPGVAMDIVVNEQASVAYIANAEGFPLNTVLTCKVDIANGILLTNTCTSISDPDHFYFDAVGLQISPDNKWLYLTNSKLDIPFYAVTVCAINPDGSLSSPCHLATDDTSGLDVPAGRIAFKLIGNTYYAYIANWDNNTVTFCPYNAADGTLGLSDGCQSTGMLPNPASVAIAGNYLYAALILPSSPFTFSFAICPINNNGTLDTCQLSDGDDMFEQGFFISNFLVQNNLAYIPNNLSQKIVFCTPNGTTLTNCSPLIQPLPNGRMTFANFNGQTYVYLTNNIDQAIGQVFKCTVQINGTFTNCLKQTLPFGENFHFSGFDLNASNTVLYATSNIRTPTGPSGNFPAVIFSLDTSGNIQSAEIFIRPGTDFDTGFLSNLLASNSNNIVYFPLVFNNKVASCSQANLDGCVFQPSTPFFVEPVSVWTTRY